MTDGSHKRLGRSTPVVHRNAVVAAFHITEIQPVIPSADDRYRSGIRIVQVLDLEIDRQSGTVSPHGGGGKIASAVVCIRKDREQVGRTTGVVVRKIGAEARASRHGGR